MTDDDLVPVSVRLGEVVPPEDPEDWTRPLTWMAAVGMLLAPVVALAWFAIARPIAPDPSALTWVLAAVLAAGAALTGASQASARWAFAATVGSGLFGALATVVIGLALAGGRQVEVASPTLSHAFLAAVAGLAGAAVASVGAALLAAHARWTRWLAAATAGVATVVTVALLVAFVA